MEPIWDYLIEGLLPNDPNEASKLRLRSARFTIHQGTLYKRGFFHIHSQVHRKGRRQLRDVGST